MPRRRDSGIELRFWVVEEVDPHLHKALTQVQGKDRAMLARNLMNWALGQRDAIAGGLAGMTVAPEAQLDVPGATKPRRFQGLSGFDFDN